MTLDLANSEGPPAPARRRRQKLPGAGYGPPTILFIALIIAWEAIVRGMHVSPIILPLPSAVFAALWNGFVGGTFAWHLAVTMTEIAAGFAAGSMLGIALGILIGQSAFLERLLYPLVIGFQTVPKVAIAPIVVIWCGYGLLSKIVITAMIAFFPILANTIVGLRSAPQDQIDMLRAHTASSWQIFRMVRLPQALPYIFVGIDVAMSLSVIGAIVGEFVGAKAGLGYLILQRNYSFDMAGVFAVLVVLSFIGIALHGLIALFQRRLLFWSDTAKSHNAAS